MSTKSLRQQDIELMKLHRAIAQKIAFLKDVELLKQINDLLNNAEEPVISVKEKELPLITKDDFLASLERGKEARATGNLYSLEDIIKETEISNLLKKYSGIGKGVWTEDAQEYVNQLREDRA